MSTNATCGWWRSRCWTSCGWPSSRNLVAVQEWEEQTCGQCGQVYVTPRGGLGNTCWGCRLYLRHRCRHCGAPLTVRTTGRHREVCSACQRVPPSSVVPDLAVMVMAPPVSTADAPCARTALVRSGCGQFPTPVHRTGHECPPCIVDPDPSMTTGESLRRSNPMSAETQRIDIASNVRRLRQARGLTQMGLAERSGLCQSWISRLERRAENPSIATLQRLASGAAGPGPGPARRSGRGPDTVSYEARHLGLVASGPVDRGSPDADRTRRARARRDDLLPGAGAPGGDVRHLGAPGAQSPARAAASGA